MQLRVLSTMSEIASDPTTTVMFPLSTDMLQLVGATLGRGDGQPQKSGAEEAEGA